MGKRTIIPFGPQHPVLPEPVHLDLVIEDETVIEAIPSIGFVHRGLEKLVETRDYNQMAYVIERICGICSFGHGWGYCASVEGALNISELFYMSFQGFTAIFCGSVSLLMLSDLRACSCIAGGSEKLFSISLRRLQAAE